jgi:hypothetical protein
MKTEDILALFDQTQVLTTELFSVRTALDQLQRSSARDRKRLAGAIAIILAAWSILTFIGFQQLTALINP